MIIIIELFLIHSRECTVYKSDVAFIYSHRVFSSTSTEDDLQAAKFVTLTLKYQNNGVRGKKIGHKISGDTLMFPQATLL